MIRHQQQLPLLVCSRSRENTPVALELGNVVLQRLRQERRGVAEPDFQHAAWACHSRQRIEQRRHMFGAHTGEVQRLHGPIKTRI